MKEFFGTVDEILGHRHVDRSAAQSANQGGSSGQGYREGGSDCIVDDLTTLGACVSVDTGIIADLPQIFDLTFDNCHTFWSCRVIWRNRNGGRVGVTWKNA
jgi:hypothetical protein